MLYNALSLGKTPNIAHSVWDFVTPPKEDRATAIGTKFGKERTCGSAGDIFADRHTVS